MRSASFSCLLISHRSRTHSDFKLYYSKNTLPYCVVTAIVTDLTKLIKNLLGKIHNSKEICDFEEDHSIINKSLEDVCANLLITDRSRHQKRNKL